MPPVEDHPVHPTTVRTDADPYGCHSSHNNPPPAGGYWAPSRHYFPDGRFEIRPVWVENVNSKLCRSHFLWDTDPRCAGCTVPKDKEYAKCNQIRN